MLVWLNGRLVDRDEAKVSIFDAGFQHGVGLFETMLVRSRRVFRLADHLERLIRSARELRLSERMRPEPLADAVRSAVDANDMSQARVRLTVTGGNLNQLQAEGRPVVDPTILIVVQPPTEYPASFFEQGVTAIIADPRGNPFDPFAGHKTLSYWPRIQTLQAAAAKHAGEAIWFTVSNHLAGGSVSNVFLVHDSELLTPIARGEEERGALPSPVLPGITRATISDLAAARGLTVRRRMLDIEDLLASDEVFLTNSSWGVLPVVRVERERVGAGSVGPVTAMLRDAWTETVSSPES